MKKIHLFSIIIFIFGLLQFRFVWDLFGNRMYREIVYKNAAEYKVDSLLIISIIKNESDFVKEAKSEKGALGLMQIMPGLASQFVEENKKEIDDLLEPENNIMVGVWYVAKLKKNFNNDIVLTLAAYNAGENNVQKWLKESPISDVEYIPYRETRNFVKRTMRYYRFLSGVQKAKKIIRIFD